MNVGMLWFDNDPHSALSAKVARAADYYHKKYGLVPDLCQVHPSMLPSPDPVGANQGLLQDGGEERVCKVALRPNRLIMPGHLWIGQEEENGSGH